MKKAFSFIPFLEIWTSSNQTGIGDTNGHACHMYNSLYRRSSVGCRFILCDGFVQNL